MFAHDRRQIRPAGDVKRDSLSQLIPALFGLSLATFANG